MFHLNILEIALFCECLVMVEKFLTGRMIVKSKNQIFMLHGITPKRVASGGAHLRGVAPGHHRNVAA